MNAFSDTCNYSVIPGVYKLLYCHYVIIFVNTVCGEPDIVVTMAL